MTDKDTMPTPGPWEWDAGDLGTEISYPKHIPYCTVFPQHDEDLVIAEVNDRFDRDQGRANARLIVAAGTAAHEVKQMEFDPVEAVRFAPRSYTVLRLLRDNLNAVIRNMGEGAGRDVLIDSVMEADMLLSHVSDPVEEVSLTRAAGKEGESHE